MWKDKIEEIVVDIFGEVFYCNLIRKYYSLFKSKRKYIEKYWEYPYKIKNGNRKKHHKKYYVFRWDYTGIGIYDTAREFMLGAQWAESKGYIPLVSLSKLDIYKRGKLGEGNFWEQSFLQCGGRSLEEVLHDDNSVFVVGFLSKRKRLKNGVMDIIVTDENWKEYYGSFYKTFNRYCKLRPELIELYDEKKRMIFPDSGKVLGVCIREVFGMADEVKKSKALRMNPKEPSLDEIIKQVEECLENWNYDYVYLSAQFKNSLDKFISIFHEKVIYYDREMPSYEAFLAHYRQKGDKIEDYGFAYESSLEQIQEDYVGQVYCLAKCDGLVGTYSGGTRAALLMNGGDYEYVKIFKEQKWE